MESTLLTSFLKASKIKRWLIPVIQPSFGRSNLYTIIFIRPTAQMGSALRMQMSWKKVTIPGLFFRPKKFPLISDHFYLHLKLKFVYMPGLNEVVLYFQSRKPMKEIARSTFIQMAIS